MHAGIRGCKISIIRIVEELLLKSLPLAQEIVALIIIVFRHRTILTGLIDEPIRLRRHQKQCYFKVFALRPSTTMREIARAPPTAIPNGAISETGK